MNVSSTGAAARSYPTQSTQRSQEAGEVKKAGPDHDGDADDGGAQAMAAKPSTNLNGQALGQIVNVRA
jgi:hypothetical protein